MSKISPQELLRFASNDRQIEVIKAVIEHGSNNKASKALGCGRRTIDIMLKRLEARAASKAVAPHKSVDRETMEGFEAKRVSTAYKSDGTVALQWVIQEPEKRDMKAKLDQMIDGIKDDLNGFKTAVKPPKKVNSDYLAMYMIGDHHFGMLADSETKMDNDDWDIKIATSIH
mgnify:FL=1